EGEVVVGFAVAAGCDPAFGFQPGVGAFDWPAVTGVRVARLDRAFLPAPDLACGLAGGDRFVWAAALADPWLDPALAQGLLERPRVVAAVGPDLARSEPAFDQRVDQRQQLLTLVFVACRQPDRKRRPTSVYGQV